MKDTPTPPKAEGKPPVELACTVLISGKRFGKVIRAKGSKISLPADQANALSALTPPIVRIDGI